MIWDTPPTTFSDACGGKDDPASKKGFVGIRVKVELLPPQGSYSNVQVYSFQTEGFMSARYL
jgi:hypothetical protein